MKVWEWKLYSHNFMLYTVAKLMIINASPKLFNLSYRKQIIVRFTKLFTKRFPKFVWNSGSSISLRSCQSNRELGNEIMNFTPNFVGKLRSLLQKKFAPFGVSLQSLATTRVHTCQKHVLPANQNLKFWQSNFKVYPPTWERFDTTPQTFERKQSRSATCSGILSFAVLKIRMNSIEEFLSDIDCDL